MSFVLSIKVNNLIQKVNSLTIQNATNTANIATNTSNIATNTTNIATNTSNIAKNTNAISTGVGIKPTLDPLHAGTNSLYYGNWIGNKDIGVYYVNSSYTRWGQNLGLNSSGVAVTWYNATSDGQSSMNSQNTGGLVPSFTVRLFSLFNAIIGEQSGDAISYKTMPNGTKTGLMFPSNGSYLIECFFDIDFSGDSLYNIYITKNYTFDGINDVTYLFNNASTYVIGFSKTVNRISTVVNITASNVDYVCIALYNANGSQVSTVAIYNRYSLVTITRL